MNAHLTELAATSGDMRPGLLVIDEIGPLELSRGGGLTAALALLDAGPAPAWPHALAVVRPTLVEDARTRFAQSWRSGELLFPDESGARRLHEALP